MEALPLYRLDANSIKACQVIVLPQMRASETFTSHHAEALRRFVHDGGGLIATHDAVGYRALPAIVPEVCPRGVQHVHGTAWIAKSEHPLTSGIPKGEVQTQSYYDYIELECGPRGTVVAVAAGSEAPVVIAGVAGKGRFVACGLGLGIAAANDADIEPTGGERTLLIQAVRWAAGQGE
jgi:type 1 glutamine amidotransferase